MPYISDESSSLYPPCFYCKHLTHLGGQDLKGWTCPAFPDGILYGILAREIDHTEELMVQATSDVFESEEYELDGEPGKYKITFEGDWIPA